MNFEAIKLYPEGWVVLSPWITLPSGQEIRLHCISSNSFGEEAKEYCQHVAEELNRAYKG